MPSLLAITLLGAVSTATWEISGNMADSWGEVSVSRGPDGGTSVESTIPMRSTTDENGLTTITPAEV